MPVEIKTTTRVFKFEKDTLPDPDPNMSPEDVVSFYSAKYPEVIAGHISDIKDLADGSFEYYIGYGVGTKA